MDSIAGGRVWPPAPTGECHASRVWLNMTFQTSKVYVAPLAHQPEWLHNSDTALLMLSFPMQAHSHAIII